MLSTPFEFQIVLTPNACIALNLRRLCSHCRSFPGQQCVQIFVLIMELLPPSGALVRPTVFVISQTVPYSVSFGGEYFF
jgi:hypothetical protein